MKAYIKRSEFNTTISERLLMSSDRNLKTFLSNIKNDPTNLSVAGVYDYALEAMLGKIALNPDEHESILYYLDTALNSLIAHYQIKASFGKPQYIFFKDGKDEIYQMNWNGGLYNQFDTPVYWITGIYLALIRRNQKAIEDLVAIPLEAILNYERYKGVEYFQYDMFEMAQFWHSFLRNQPKKNYLEILKKVESAVKSADKKKVLNYTFKVYLLEKEVEMLLQLLEEMPLEGFNDNMYEATLRFKEIRGNTFSDDTSNDPAQSQYEKNFVALGLTAIASLAHDKDIKLDFASDYLPQWLVEGAFSIKTELTKPTLIQTVIPESLKLLTPSSPYKLPPEITKVFVSEDIKNKGQNITATLFSYYLNGNQKLFYKVDNIKLILTDIHKSDKVYTFENIEPFMVILNQKAQHFPKNMKIVIKQENVKKVG